MRVGECVNDSEIWSIEPNAGPSNTLGIAFSTQKPVTETRCEQKYVHGLLVFL